MAANRVCHSRRMGVDEEARLGSVPDLNRVLILTGKNQSLGRGETGRGGDIEPLKHELKEVTWGAEGPICHEKLVQEVRVRVGRVRQPLNDLG